MYSLSASQLGFIGAVAALSILTYFWLLHIVAPSPTSSRLRAEYGLRRIHPSLDQPAQSEAPDWTRTTTVVVFVHGLGADPTKTWCHGSTRWVTDLFVGDLQQKGLGPSVQLFAFDYDSFWVRDANSTSLRITATSLGRALKSSELHGCNIVLVGHSYGGLVIKKALVLNSDLQPRIRGVVFLGTPHRGTPFNRFGTLAARLLIPLHADVDIMRSLAYDNIDLDDLEKDFGLHYKGTLRRYFFETQKTRRELLGILPYVREFVVPRQSATFGADTSEAIPLHTDHRGLNKFACRDDNYRSFSGELLTILDTSTRINSKGPGSSETPSERRWMVPYPNNPDFVGRSDILGQLKDRLGHTREMSGTSQARASLSGLGGVGKTQVALAYIFWLQETCPAISVFWVHASNAERFRQAYASIAQECQIPGYQDPQTDVLPLVKEWLEKKEHGQWLMVIDNADDAQLFFGQAASTTGSIGPSDEANLARYLPECAHGAILATTRNKQVGIRLTKGQQPVEVAHMDNDESEHLLRVVLKGIDATSAELSTLSDRLEHLPLALAQGAAFIQETSITVHKYLQLLDKSDQNAVHLLSKEFEAVGRDSEAPQAVAQTWMLSFQQIEQQNALASEMLSFMSLFDRQDIPEAFLSFYIEQKRDVEFHSEMDLIEALGVLKAFSFVTENSSGNFDMHRLVQIVTRKWLTSRGMIRQFRGNALVTVSCSFPCGDFDTRKTCAAYLSHANAVLSLDNFDSADEAAVKATLLHSMAEYFHFEGKFIEAETYIAEAANIRFDLFGKNDHSTLMSMATMANLCRDQGRPDMAETLALQVMEARKSKLGADHPDTLWTMSSLAKTYRRLGKVKEAEQISRQVMETSITKLGIDHRHTLTSMANLAVILMFEDQLEEAEKLMKEVVKTEKAILAPDHPSLLVSMCNLATTLSRQGRLEEAEQIEVHVWETQKTNFGVDHPHTLTAMGNLAFTWFEMGKESEALDLMRTCAGLRQSKLGLTHPYTTAAFVTINAWENKAQKPES